MPEYSEVSCAGIQYPNQEYFTADPFTCLVLTVSLLCREGAARCESHQLSGASPKQSNGHVMLAVDRQPKFQTGDHSPVVSLPAKRNCAASAIEVNLIVSVTTNPAGRRKVAECHLIYPSQ